MDILLIDDEEVLRQAFMEITGIEVKHDNLGEKDVVEKIQTQMQTDRHIYDIYVNDSDLIGTHYRYGKIEPLTDFMKGDGKAFTLPTLDLDDFIGLSFITAPDGKMYQLPDQQFANLYWFRYDWFNRPELKKQFKEIYGYELGVPVIESFPASLIARRFGFEKQNYFSLDLATQRELPEVRFSKFRGSRK